MDHLGLLRRIPSLSGGLGFFMFLSVPGLLKTVAVHESSL